MGICIELTEEQLRAVVESLLLERRGRFTPGPPEQKKRRYKKQGRRGGEPAGEPPDVKEPPARTGRPRGSGKKYEVCAGCERTFKKSLLSDYNGDRLCPECLRKME